MAHKNPHTGSSFEDFLREEGMYEEITTRAVKRLLAMQIEKAMKKRKLSKNKFAAKMGTSRAALDRLLDPHNPSVTLLTITKAASVLGKQVNISFVDTR